MFRRFILTGLVALTVALAGSAIAAEKATLVLRSGERISGELVDLGGVGFTFRVKGEERQYRRGEVARIEFGGESSLTGDQQSQIKSGQHALVLNDGSLVVGRLHDIGGKAPLRITMDTPSGQREFPSSRIRAIYLTDTSDGPDVGTSGVTPGIPEGTGILVPGNERWVDTGITVREGQQVSFNARGEIQLSNDSGDRANPSGSLRGRKPSGPLPDILAGGLLGRVGPMAPFAIGGGAQTVRMPASGRLFLGINDDEVGDNKGAFRVDVRPQSR